MVWFGEALPQLAQATAFQAADACDLFLSIGTSGLVEPAASLAFSAFEAGARVIEVNPQPTPLTGSAWIALPGAAGEVLPQLMPLESAT